MTNAKLSPIKDDRFCELGRGLRQLGATQTVLSGMTSDQHENGQLVVTTTLCFWWRGIDLNSAVQ